MEVLEKRQKILDILLEIEKELEKHPETIPDHVFQSLEGFCKLIYAWKYSEKKPGWTKPLGYFTPEDGAVVESRFEDFNTQDGGGPTEDKQFAEEYKQFQTTLEGVSEQWRELVSVLGVITTNTLEKAVKTVKNTLSIDDSLLNSDISGKFSRKKEASNIILAFFSTLLESLRIWVAFSYIDSTTYRILLSFSQIILDTVRGNVRHALISSLGIFGQHGFYISILTKFLLNIIETISPELPKQIELDIYKNIKTLSSAGLLWGYYTFAPLTLKYNINQVFEEVKKIAKEEDIGLDSLTTQIKKTAKEKEIEVPDIPLDTVPNYEDIQLLASLLGNPEIACLPSFKKLIFPLRSVFTLRLTLDLLNVPTGQAELEDLCVNQKTSTRKNTGQKGGKRKHKTRRVISV